MKAIMVMFDSLNRHLLPPYGGDWVHAPNFERLAKKSATFDKAYVGSMPCIPARRELHTGRYNFLHRSWGPLEPFDDSMPEILKSNGVYPHLVTDHQHYWEDGGATYHNRYASYEFIRGQEGDFWKGQVAPLEVPEPTTHNETHHPRMWLQDFINRTYIQSPEDHPQAKTFDLGLEFMRTNSGADDWFLQIETFDPHEPFFAPQKYRDLYSHEYEGPPFDWPPYQRVTEPAEQVEHLRYEYAALVSMCDDHLGRVLDLMDELDMWDDTMLIVGTDHGFLLGERGWWGKYVQPFYDEVASPPLFIWDPRCRVSDEHRTSLVQWIDVPATLLEYFGLDLPPDMQGRPLRDTIANDTPVRESALFGIHGGHVNCTDGRYIYMRAPDKPENEPLYEYTLMPTQLRYFLPVEQLQAIELAEPFPFTKGCRVMRFDARPWMNPHEFGTLLFDLEEDPEQEKPMSDPEVEKRMIELLTEQMKENNAPPEQFSRLGLPVPPDLDAPSPPVLERSAAEQKRQND